MLEIPPYCGLRHSKPPVIRLVAFRHVKSIESRIEKILPIKEMYLIGSFASKKRRPADIDFVIMLKTDKHKTAKWSFDLVMAPDNSYGEYVLKDVKQWVKQKYGVKKSEVVRIR